jgi:hypothetical protein
MKRVQDPNVMREATANPEAKRAPATVSEE